MNEHQDIRGLLPLAASGDIPHEDMRRVREHLANCAACRLASDDLSALGVALRGLPTPQPRREFVARVRELAESSLARRREERRAAALLAPLVAASWIFALATWPLARAAVQWMFTGWRVTGADFGAALGVYSILGLIPACVSAFAVAKRARAIGRIR